MSAFVYVELDVFACVLLVIMSFGRVRGDAQSLEQRLFHFVLISNALALVFDAMQWLFDGRIFPGSHLMVTLIAYAYYLMTAIVPFTWLIYCDYKVYGSLNDLKHRLRVYFIPFGASIAAIIVNIWTSCAFYIDGACVYHRGAQFLIVSVVMFSPAFLAGILTIHRAIHGPSAIERKEAWYLSYYFTYPVAGYVAQTLVYGLPLIWICATVSLFLIYIKVQYRLVFTDELTGASNRRQIGREFARRIEASYPAQAVYAIMIDADDFKKINDTYGHATGDALLVNAAKMLEKICAPRRDFLARMGGDEFLILATRRLDEPFRLLDEIDAAMLEYNRTTDEKYLLSLSCGAAAFGNEGIDTLDRLLSAADGIMFFNKSARKKRNGQSAM